MISQQTPIPKLYPMNIEQPPRVAGVLGRQNIRPRQYTQTKTIWLDLADDDDEAMD